jgi:hypothetical protein
MSFMTYIGLESTGMQIALHVIKLIDSTATVDTDPSFLHRLALRLLQHFLNGFNAAGLVDVWTSVLAKGSTASARPTQGRVEGYEHFMVITSPDGERTLHPQGWYASRYKLATVPPRPVRLKELREELGLSQEELESTHHAPRDAAELRFIRLSRTFGFAEAEGFHFRMCTVGVDWQPLTNHRAVANFCTPAPRRSYKTWPALQIRLQSRRTLCIPVCTPASLVKKRRDGRWLRWRFVGPPSHLPKYAKS